MIKYIGCIIAILVLLILHVTLMIINFHIEFKEYMHDMKDTKHENK